MTPIQPTFVTHLPKELVPLAKLSPDDPTTVEVFECCINGQEISPGYSEQNDPVAQREALEHQAGGEQQKLDEDFLAALEHGMPPDWPRHVPEQFAPSGRLIAPEEIAACAVYWLGDESRPISGAVVELEQYSIMGRNPNKVAAK